MTKRPSNNMLGGALATLLRRRLIRANGCWDWPGERNHGYGIMYVRGKRQRVHVVAARLFRVPGDGPFVLHRCDRPSCFSPEHLFRGTHADNMADARAKGRMLGPKRPLRALTADQVRRVRELWITRRGMKGAHPAGPTLAGLAREFGISRGVIDYIVRGLTYRET